jgi:hypothetical protein
MAVVVAALGGTGSLALTAVGVSACVVNNNGSPESSALFFFSSCFDVVIFLSVALSFSS